MRERLVELSGIKERGINPDELNVSDEYLPTLLKAAEEALSKDTSLTTDSNKDEGSASAISRTRRQHI
jgi:hypothetical protein